MYYLGFKHGLFGNVIKEFKKESHVNISARWILVPMDPECSFAWSSWMDSDVFGLALSPKWWNIKAYSPKKWKNLATTTTTFWPTTTPTDPNMKHSPTISAKITSQLTEGSPCAEGSGEFIAPMLGDGMDGFQKWEHWKSWPFGPNKPPPITLWSL